jgi:CBS domain-containing protein
MESASQVVPFVQWERAIDATPLLVSPETPLTEVLQQMSQRSLGAMASVISSEPCPIAGYALVQQRGKLRGILTERDVLRLAAQGNALVGKTIADVMTTELVTKEWTECAHPLALLGLLHQQQIQHLPILGEQGQLLGVVNRERLQQELLHQRVVQLEYEQTDLLRQRLDQQQCRSQRRELMLTIANRIQQSLNLWEAAVSNLLWC